MKTLILAGLLAVGCASPKVVVQGEKYLIIESTEALDQFTKREGHLCKCANLNDGQTVFTFFTTEGCAVGDTLYAEIKFLH